MLRHKSLVALLLTLVAMACFPGDVLAQKACTEMGCTNGLILRSDPARDWKNGNYVFEFVLDNRRVRCWGELPLKPCEGGPSLTCNKPGVTITESGCALPASSHGFGDIVIDGDPRRVMVRIAHNNRAIVTRSIAAQYEKTWPNGLGCGPVCSSATYDLFAATKD